MEQKEHHHTQKVLRIAEQLKAFNKGMHGARIVKKGVSHMVPLPADPRFRGRPIDIKTLNEILSLDLAEKTCTAEPGVTFSQLLKATLPHGLIPTVVPELEDITLGGAVAGCSLESMSYRYGGFHDSCLEYQIVKSNGEVLTCSPEKNPFYFEMLHGSYGTLAILSRLKFRLIPAKPFVRLQYHRFNRFGDFYTGLLEHCEPGGHDFVDAIIHGVDEFILCVGKFVDQAPYTSDYHWLNIYYKSTQERTEDFLSTYDYCFRYDAECHWMTATAPPLQFKPIRFLLGKFLLGSKNLIAWSNRLEPIMKLKRRPDVVCDVFIPADRFEQFFSWYERDFRFFPLWVIPYRAPKIYPWIDDCFAEGFASGLFIDCAVYGKANNDPHLDFSELLEEKTTELNGLKTLISKNHFSRERFWSIFNKANYDRAKEELDPSGLFPNLYDKFHG